ncbi:MAG: hypothetical protein IBX63_10185 [Coriobacteriia bacterium]|nr:hypothetical protein [Coriobacteriia bacterium]
MTDVSARIHGKRVYADIDESQRQHFDALREKMKINGARAFMIAATYGHLNRVSLRDLKTSGKGYARLETFTYPSGLEMLGIALGLDSGKAIDDFEGCWRMAEEYAAGGMAMLQSEFESPSGVHERIEALVLDQLKKLSEAQRVRAE